MWPYKCGTWRQVVFGDGSWWRVQLYNVTQVVFADGSWWQAQLYNVTEPITKDHMSRDI